MRLVLLIALLAGMLTTASAATREPFLYNENRSVLSKLEAAGFGFEHLFGADKDADLEALHASSAAYRTIVEIISGDLKELRADIAAGGRRLDEFTANETGRVMDMRWLSSPAARLRLIGIVNRIDRRDFHDVNGETSCGEVRLIYRLGYSFRKDGKGKVLASRMPFNFNAVFDLPTDADGGCAGVAARLTQSADEAIDAGWIKGALLDGLRFRQLELNAQMVRFPSGQEPQFGGQAVYLMRIFGIDGNSVAEIPMENTPDTARLKDDAAMKAELVAYVRGASGEIDEGVYLVPERFLARKVVSWSTFGGARPVNHPYAGLLSTSDFAGLDFAEGRLVRSAEALIARLDNGTCQGCHQAGSTAGFHVLGLDDEATSPLNRILVGTSPHMLAELPRRAAYVAAVSAEREPDRFRPLSFAPPAEWTTGGPAYEDADAGQQCIAGAYSAFGETWGCAGGTVCTPLARTEDGNLQVAQCLLPAESEEMFSGHPCLAGDVTASAATPFKDKYELTQFAAFAEKASPRDYTCRPPRIGVPGGMAYRQCNEKDRAFSAFRGDGDMPCEVCGLTGGKKFDLCVSSGNVDSCLAGAVQRGNRAACSADHPCRDDYICQAFPADTPNVRELKGKVGFCSPTYFMFQMRIDSHTTPWKSRSRAEPYRSVEVGPGEDPDDLW